MKTNQYFLWILAGLLSVSFCAASAMAEVPHPEAYEHLTAVEMAPGQAPLLRQGIGALNGQERRYQERLPVQLDGALKKVKSVKYKKYPRRAKRA